MIDGRCGSAAYPLPGRYARRARGRAALLSSAQHCWRQKGCPWLPLLKDGTRVQTVSSAEVFWLAPDTGDVPRVAIAIAMASLYTCKKAGSGGFGACVAERASPSSPERTGPFGWGATYAQARKNQQLLVSYRPLARFFAWLTALSGSRAVPRKVVAHLLAIPTASSALREL